MQWFKHQKFMSDRCHKIAKRIIYYLSEQTQRAIDLRKKMPCMNTLRGNLYIHARHHKKIKIAFEFEFYRCFLYYVKVQTGRG